MAKFYVDVNATGSSGSECIGFVSIYRRKRSETCDDLVEKIYFGPHHPKLKTREQAEQYMNERCDEFNELAKPYCASEYAIWNRIDKRIILQVCPNVTLREGEVITNAVCDALNKMDEEDE